MDKKQKNVLPTTTSEKEGKNEKKKMKRSKAEELNVYSKEPEDLENETGKQGDHSEASVKGKMGLGAKRTKKPPKSLENFICRPPIRVSQKPGPVIAGGSCAKSKSSNQLHHPAPKKCNNASAAAKTSSTTTIQKQSHASLTSSKKGSASSDSPKTTTKKVPAKQTRNVDLKSSSTPKEPPSTAQPHSSRLPSFAKIKSSTPIKQTSPHTTVPSPLQQDSSPHEEVKVLNENVIKQAQAFTNTNRGSPSETKERSSKRNPVSTKKKSFLSKNVSNSESNSGASLSMNLNRKEDAACVQAPRSPNSDSRTITNEKNKYQNGSMQQPSSCANNLPQNLPLGQAAGSSSPSKCTDGTSDLSQSSKISKVQNENEDLNSTLEMTMKSSQTFSILEQQERGCTEGSLDDENGKRIKHGPNQEEIKCMSDTSNLGSVLNPKIVSTPAEPSMNGSPSCIKQDKIPSKKQKIKHRCSKTAKMTCEHIYSPVACTSVLKDSSQNDTPKAPSSLQCEQKPAGQTPKLKQCRTTEVSSKIPQMRKRGRPKASKLEVPLRGNNSHPSFTDSPNNQNPQSPDPEVDVRQQRSIIARKRGRPKGSFSAHSRSSQPTLTSKQQDTRDCHMTSEDKVKDTHQKCNKSNRLIMKTIIRKINKMKVKRKDQVLTQILLGQKQCNSAEFPQERSREELGNPVSPATHSLSSLVTSFGGKLGPQINVSKRGTIYMGKRRGRKPKCEKNSNVDSNQILSPSCQMSADTAQFCSSSTTIPKSLAPQIASFSLKNNASSSITGRSSQINLNSQKVKATSFTQLGELHNSRARREAAFTSSIGVGVNDNSPLGRSDKETNGRLAASTRLPSKLATGSVFTMSGVQGSNSLRGKSKAPSSFSSEHVSSTCLPLGPGLAQDSNGAHIVSPPLAFTNQETHKFKCHRRSHHCLSRDKLRRHKYKCKKKYMQLKAKRQDPNFLAEVEDLTVRLREIHIVHHITRTRLEDGASTVGRKSVKGKSQSHDLQCLQEDVHPPTMFQINFSGYYSPHSTLSCDPLHYVRMANMRRKHGCSSDPSEPIVTHFPVMHKLGYPISGGGFFHPSYKVPFTTTSLGFGLYRGYPATTPLYPSSFPSSYVHHYSKNPIISPSKFHKKKTKIPRQDSGGLWGGKSLGSYTRMTPTFSCDCFSRQSWQREKQREKGQEGRDEHGRMREREQDIEWLLWQNKPTKKHENVRDCSSKPSSFSVFSNVPNKEKSFPPNMRQTGEVRWSEHQPPWRCKRGSETKHSNKTLNQEFSLKDNEETLEEPESDGEYTAPQQSSTRTHCLLKQPKLLGSTQRRIKKGNGVASASSVLTEPDGTLMQDFSSLGDKLTGYVHAGNLHYSGKHQCSDSPSARDSEKTQRELKVHKPSRRPLIHDAGDQACEQTSAHFMQKPTQLHLKHPTKPAQHFKSAKARNPPRLEVTAGNEVKKRGRGRPRKNPPSLPYKRASSPLPFLSVPPLPPPLTEEMELTGKGGKDKQQSDLSSEVIKTVVHGEQRKRGRKRKITETDRDGEQKQVNEEAEETEASSHFYTFSECAGASPDQTPPMDAEADADSQSGKISASAPNKKYLWAGLYSDVYKTEDIHEPQEEFSESLDYNPEEHEHGLLPAPLHVGKYLRLKRIDFQLPYDIHWLCAHDKLFEKFEEPESPPQTTTYNGSCKSHNESVAQYSADDCPHTRLTDRSDQAEVQQPEVENEQHYQLLQQQEESHDDENFPSPLSSEERSFVMEHGVFLVRNYEKMRARQAVLLLREQEKEEDEEEKESIESEDRANGGETSTQPDRCLNEPRSSSEEEEQSGAQKRNLKRTLQEIWDRIVSCKGSSGQTLTAPLLNLCSRKRSDSALLDLSMVQKQLQSGHYHSLEAFHTDMLRVFHCAEKYYGCESSVGRDVSQLRLLYHKAHQEASSHISSFL